MTEAEVGFMDSVPSPRRRRDARTLLALMERVTGQPARRWGGAVRFGSYHYKYASGPEGDAAQQVSPRARRR